MRKSLTEKNTVVKQSGAFFSEVLNCKDVLELARGNLTSRSHQRCFSGHYAEITVSPCWAFFASLNLVLVDCDEDYIRVVFLAISTKLQYHAPLKEISLFQCCSSTFLQTIINRPWTRCLSHQNFCAAIKIFKTWKKGKIFMWSICFMASVHIFTRIYFQNLEMKVW